MAQLHWALAGCCLVALACCVSDPLIKPGSPSFPEHNLGRHKIIEIHGKISPTLSLSLMAIYQTTSRDRACRFLEGGIGEGSGGREVHVLLPVEESSGTFNSIVSVDEFVPGECKWVLAYVDAALRKGNSLSAYNTVIDNYSRYYRQDTLENDRSNSSPKPVVWKCKSIGNERPLCDAGRGQKEIYRASATTRTVAMEFLDLDK
jgi:hypothetical protein